jgi:hypothetical protein
MTISAWKTSFIGLSKPPKVLGATVSASENLELWPYALGTDDPYWSGGVNPLPYRYKMTFSFIDQGHGSHLTRTPFLYNAQDIEVGDFVAGADDGKVLQVMSIISKDDYNLVAIVEDRLRYNVYKTGSSIFNVPGNVIFFQINELGVPMLDPLPGTAGSTFYANVMSRFQYMNPLTNYVLEKTAHGFEKGDAICIEGGEFVLSDPDNITKFIGTVVESGPGPDQFILRPANGIIDFVPGLPGNVGDYIYPKIDGSGDLTTNDESQRPIFMKVADAIATYTIGSNLDPTGIDGDVVEINKIQVTLSSGSGTYTLTDAITAINALTSDHKLTADAVNGATSVISDFIGVGSAYGVVAGYTPFSASINGVTINFTTTTSGSVAFGDPTVANASDMAADINAAKIPNINASVSGAGELVLINSIGTAITIVNITNDANGTPWAGANSLSSLALNTAANTTNFVLRLQRLDGGPMTLRDVQGQFFTTAGVISGQNGRYALGLYIEQGLRSSKTTMVANIAARNALYPLPGDQAYVIDDGNGEWAVFLYDGASWQRVSNQRSDATDARTYTTDFDLSSITSTGIVRQSLGHISAGRTVISAKVLVTGVCPAGTTITVGTDTSPNEFFEGNDAILTQSGQYNTTPDYRTNTYTEVVAELNLPTLGIGYVTVILTYV